MERANACFAAEAEVAHARAVIEAHASAVARGEGVVVLDGRLVEICTWMKRTGSWRCTTRSPLLPPPPQLPK